MGRVVSVDDLGRLDGSRGDKERGRNWRVIFHVDMDQFYAAVEQREHPEFAGQPVIVGADPKEGTGSGGNM